MARPAPLKTIPHRTYKAVLPEVPIVADDFKAATFLSAQHVHPDVEPTPVPHSVKRRVKRAEPTHSTDDGDKFWPVFVDNTGLPVHPNIVAHDILNGAVLATPLEEIADILDHLEKLTGGLTPNDGEYHAVMNAAITAERKLGAERLAEILATAPDLDVDADSTGGGIRRVPSPAWLVPVEDVALILQRDVDWCKRNSNKANGLPKPVVITQNWYYRSDELARMFGGGGAAA